MKVLVVDDDVVSRMVLMHLVNSCGSYEIFEAEDGEDAWAQLHGGLQPVICFCDLRMPRLSGLELLARINGVPALAAMRFVLASSANDHATMAQASGMGADGYLVKPFEQGQVLAELAGLTAQASAGADAESARATMARLGVDSTRLLAYLAGFGQQLGAAADSWAGASAAPTVADHGSVEKLHAGCITLGLQSAARRFAMLDGATASPAALAAAVATALDEVGHKTAALRALAPPAA
ncbi:response regulator [Massilia sp. PWRC2]|uniref:response regulator n=1 Tax=Massilia sp. PWRC2 TaxID=2804626 RepID=UPI003CEF8EB9